MKTRFYFLIALVLLFGSSYSPAPVKAAQTEAGIPPNIVFKTVLSGLNQPVFATHAGDGSQRLFIAQRDGKILIWDGTSLVATPFLNVGGIIKTEGGEQGLLGLAFDPNYASNGYFYIAYTNKTGVGNSVLARYKVSGSPNLADPASAQVLLTITQPYENHNGGMIAFGPDGYLYVGVGDGGSGGDPENRAQNLGSMLGKILRLDVSTVPYTIPTTNPFYNSPGVRKEIWAYGVRNPWRFSFDKSTGDLYLADVGQGTEEEINFQAANAAGGANYGWRIREGNQCFNPSSGCVSPAGYVAPVATYLHDFGCSVTGGYVYRGNGFPELKGVYLYGDFCNGNLWGLYKNASQQWVGKLIGDTGYNISSFAEAENGELYLLDYGGRLIRITSSPIRTTTIRSAASLDGFVIESGENSGVGGSISSSDPAITVGDTASDQQARSILSFNTNGLPDDAVIVAVTVRVKKTGQAGNPFIDLGELVLDLGNPLFRGNALLQKEDFQAASEINRVGVFPMTSSDGWYAATLAKAGLSKINLAGHTQFRLRFTIDDNDNLTNDRINFVSGNAAAAQPELIINYYLP